MPRKPVDYLKTIIYKIVSKDLSITECYVGHTTDFTNRKNKHKSACNNPRSQRYNVELYQYIRENGGFDNWDMLEIEKYPCTDANEARAKERYHYEQLQAKLNSVCPNRSSKECAKRYQQLNREKELKRHQVYGERYRELNREKELKRHSEYRQKRKQNSKL
jgi:predicted GIY-YIG superfamily endonuclease